MTKKTTPFRALQAKYNVKSPHQVQMKILWAHVQAITLAVCGESPENLSKIREFNREWEIAEKEGNRRKA